MMIFVEVNIIKMYLEIINCRIETLEKSAYCMFVVPISKQY